MNDRVKQLFMQGLHNYVKGAFGFELYNATIRPVFEDEVSFHAIVEIDERKKTPYNFKTDAFLLKVDYIYGEDDTCEELLGDWTRLIVSAYRPYKYADIIDAINDNMQEEKWANEKMKGSGIFDQYRLICGLHSGPFFGEGG